MEKIMNERIKEMVEQTHLFDNYEMVGGEQTKVYGFTYAGITTFAELITKECADLCDRFQARGAGMQPAECAGAIRNMFGVK